MPILVKAFTLIELLVVIAIIAILAAILFPVFARVKEQAKQTACLSNTKQLALGVIMYTDDFDGTLPPCAVNNGFAIVLWPDEVGPYIKNDQVRLCPSDSLDKLNSYGLNELTFTDLTDPNAPLPINESQFQHPSDTVMLGELGVGSPGNFNDFTKLRMNAYKMTAPDVDLNDIADARPAPRHNLHTNLAFMDGHSKSFRLDQFYTGQNPQDKWFLP